MADNSKQKLRHKFWQFFWRSWAIQTSWNYERQMSMGFMYGMAPTIDEIYGKNSDTPEKVKRMVRTTSIESFSKTAKKEGFNYSVQVIKASEIKTPIRYESMLKGKSCIFIERLHLIDNEPVMLEYNYFPVPRFLGLEKMDLTQSLYAILQSNYHIIKLSSRDMIVSAVSASVDEAKFLKKSVGFPLLLLKICVEDENGKVVHTGRHHVVSDRYKFHI